MDETGTVHSRLETLAAVDGQSERPTAPQPCPRTGSPARTRYPPMLPGPVPGRTQVARCDAT